MYYESRAQAGQLLAARLIEKYRYENCAVIALGDGSVLVADQIAAQLHCPLTMLVTEGIEIPGESTVIGAVSQGGNFTYNSEFTQGQVTEFASEFHGYLEDQKRQAFNKINRLIGDGGLINPDILRERVIVLVSDGLADGAIITVAIDFLKPIRVAKLIVASPTATVPVIDQLHIAVDEMHILDVKENFMGVDHYFDNNDIPEHEEVIAAINENILHWQ